MSQLDMEFQIEKKKIYMKTLNEHTTKQWLINKRLHIIGIEGGTT